MAEGTVPGAAGKGEGVRGRAPFPPRILATCSPWQSCRRGARPQSVNRQARDEVGH